MSGSPAAQPLRVAIVGLGPKGLFAFERLVHHARGVPAGSIELTIYEPHTAPGAGPWYDPAQPEYLRMNFAAEMVNMWPARSGLGPSFSEWRDEHLLGGDAYPPRAHVGRYLLDGFRGVLASAPDGVTVTNLAETVTLIEKTAGTWRIAAGRDREYDEVLIATGHARGWVGALNLEPKPGLEVVASVFPVDRYLTAEKIPAGAVVAIRGFALTMIDASLALTEGRGGKFIPGRRPHLMDYVPGEGEVGAIIPYSRTGRPMLAKPDPALAIGSPKLEEIATEGREVLAALPEGSSLERAVVVIEKMAEKSLASVEAYGAETEAVGRRIADAISGRVTPTDLTPAEEIEQSIDVAVGDGAPGADSALGHAWRSVYPAVVSRLGGNGLPEEDWPAFRRLATEMERISFGPPPVNAAKLLALIERGKVDTSTLTSGLSPEAQVVVDAVIPAPGVVDIEDALLGSLFRTGHIRVPPGRRGLELTRDVECVGADGSTTRGLGVIGRPTEDWIIGNDTLNRSLHPQPERWARRVAGRARS